MSHQHGIPQLRLHKATQQAYINVAGSRRYLGKWGLPETNSRYHRLAAEIAANGGTLPPDPKEITVAEVAAQYIKHATNYYRHADGTETSEVHCIRLAIRRTLELYGSEPAVEFGPNALRTVRQSWISEGLSRKTINMQTGRIRRMFKWAVSCELIPGTVYHALIAVDGLRRGRSDARETESVKPVPEKDIEAIRPFVSRQVWALIQLQLCSGARSGELLELHPRDIDRSGPVWTATLKHHKTSHFGRLRTLCFGPQAQEVLRPFLLRRADAYLFNPQEAEAERYARCPVHRRPDQRPTPKKTDREVGERYTVISYHRAVARACVAAGVPGWHPHQLRHNAATRARREFGLEAAQVMLGHASADVTQLYAEINEQRALEIAARIG